VSNNRTVQGRKEKMIQYLYRHDKDYSRYNIIKKLLLDSKCVNEIYILLPFSKNYFFKYFLLRSYIVNDFFISNYDTYVYDRQKISKYNPRAWWKFVQDFVNFRFSKYILSDTQAHFKYWESLFGTYSGKHFVLPVLADKSIYYPSKISVKHKKVKILFYGSFIPLHGIEVILQAFKILEENNIVFEAKIIGNGQTYKKMKKNYDNLAFNFVKMDGKLMNESSLADEIRNSDIILGVFGNSKKAESVVPNKVYQALACKKALITMKSSAIDEFFFEGDLIQCPNDYKSVAVTIKELIENSEIRENIAIQGYNRFIELYDKTQIEFEEFLCKVGQ
jgi:glycosyltransferase involved in cell wall biosynthesis